MFSLAREKLVCQNKLIVYSVYEYVACSLFLYVYALDYISYIDSEKNVLHSRLWLSRQVFVTTESVKKYLSIYNDKLHVQEKIIWLFQNNPHI